MKNRPVKRDRQHVELYPDQGPYLSTSSHQTREKEEGHLHAGNLPPGPRDGPLAGGPHQAGGGALEEGGDLPSEPRESLPHPVAAGDHQVADAPLQPGKVPLQSPHRDDLEGSDLQEGPHLGNRHPVGRLLYGDLLLVVAPLTEGLQEPLAQPEDHQDPLLPVLEDRHPRVPQETLSMSGDHLLSLVLQDPLGTAAVAGDLHPDVPRNDVDRHHMVEVAVGDHHLHAVVALLGGLQNEPGGLQSGGLTALLTGAGI